MRSADRDAIVIFTLCTAAAVVLVSMMVSGYLDCTARGGKYVRGVVWFTCIEARP